jgi:hypothetical protein
MHQLRILCSNSLKIFFQAYFSFLWRDSNENSQNYTVMYAMSVCPFISTEQINNE